MKKRIDLGIERWFARNVLENADRAWEEDYGRKVIVTEETY